MQERQLGGGGGRPVSIEGPAEGAFRQCSQQPVGKKRLNDAERVVERLNRDPTRGEVYWFLWDEYDGITQQQATGRRISWKSVLAEMQALGLTNGAGKPIDNVETLRSTFATVRRDKRREAEAKQQRAAERRRPTNDPPPVVSRTVAPAPAPAPAPAYQPPSRGGPSWIKTVPREVVEAEARLAYERRPDLFPHGPDVLRYKILKESGKRL